MINRRFATFSWVVLLYTLGIILWGAFVRASGSGAGCGSHWPLCNGEIIPRAPQIETLIEFSHRISSGVGLLLVVWLFVWAFRSYPKKHLVRLGASLSLFFMITEALVGAGLVLFSLVADNASMARAMFMAVHLANTFFLVAAMTLTSWWAYGGTRLYLRGQGVVAWLLLLGCFGTLMLGVSGAVTALGDTLILAGTLGEGASMSSHFLYRLRVLHPAIAIATSLYVILVGGIARFVHPSPQTRTLSRGLSALFVLQLFIGTMNIYLMAPIWMQLVHLLMADAVWIVLVLLTATVLSQQPAPVVRARTVGPGWTPLGDQRSPGGTRDQ